MQAPAQKYVNTRLKCIQNTHREIKNKAFISQNSSIKRGKQK